MAGTLIRKNDTIIVIVGKDRGKKGRVLRVIRDKDRVLVEKVNFIKRHTKPSSTQRQGGIIEKESSIHISNVMIYCEKCQKGVRVKSRQLDDGTAARLCAGCGESLS